MAAGHVQSSGTFSTATSTALPKAYVTPVTAGNLLVCGFEWGATTQTASVADNVNGAWTPVATSLANNPSLGLGGKSQIFYRENSGSGTITVTATTSASTDYKVLNIAEYSGMATSGATDGGGQSTGSSAAPSASVTTTVAHDLCVGAVQVANSATAGAGLNSRVITDGNGLEDLLDKAAAGAQAMAWTQPSGQWAASAAAFQIAGGAPAAVGNRLRRWQY